MGAPVSKIEAAEEKTAEELLSAFKHMAAGERREHATVYNYWLSIRRERELPPIRDLDALEISDVAPRGVLLELIDGGDDAQLLHVGEALRDGVQATKISEAANPSLLSCIASKLGLIAISRNALAIEDHFVGPDGTSRCSVTLLPFSTGGETVDFVYCLVSLETGISFVEETPEEPAVEAAEVAEVDTADETPVETAPEEVEPVAESIPEVVETSDPPASELAEEAPEPIVDETPTEPIAHEVAEEIEREAEAGSESRGSAKPGFSSKVFDALAGAKGFFGTVAAAPDQEAPPESIAEEVAPVAEEPAPVPAESMPVMEEPAPAAEEFTPIAEDNVPADQDSAPEDEERAAEAEDSAIAESTPIEEEPARIADQDDTFDEEPAAVADESIPQAETEQTRVPMEGSLQSKLTEVRSKADEARMARLRSDALLLEGLSQAYDFALDAEDAPEEYLKLVEAQGLKIQLRSPMKPVVKLAFDGYCDEPTIKNLEAVLAWALKSDLPRGTLLERIEAEGGMEAVLSGPKRRTSDAN